MDKLKNDARIIQNILAKHSQHKAEDASNLSNKLIIGSTSQDFMLLEMGWQNKRYQHHILFHIELKDEKIWVHQDNTDVGIAYEIEAAGIARDKIVLGFVPPYAQGVQGFAVAT